MVLLYALFGAALLVVALFLSALFGGRRHGVLQDKAPPEWIVLDGSNIMYWKDNTPRIEPVREVLARLTEQGFTPGVVFDANAGYLLTGKYQHHQPFGCLLDLPEDRVMVVPKGTVADTMVLTAARDLNARIVTNDRYRDWTEQYPEIRKPGHLIRGGYRDGELWLRLDGAAERGSP